MKPEWNAPLTHWNTITFDDFRDYAMEVYHHSAFAEDAVVNLWYTLTLFSEPKSKAFLVTYLDGMMDDNTYQQMMFIPLSYIQPHFKRTAPIISFEGLSGQHAMGPEMMHAFRYMYLLYHHCGGTVSNAEWLWQDVHPFIQDTIAMGFYETAWDNLIHPTNIESPLMHEELELHNL